MTTPNAAAALERLEQIECEMRKPGHAPFALCVKWAEELATLRQSIAQQGESLTDTFVQQVPDKCDRITWRGHYYHLPITHPAAVDEVAQQGEVACYRLTHVGTKTDWVSGAPSEYTKEYAARDGYRVELAFTHPAAVDEARFTLADLNAEYTQGRKDGFDAACKPLTYTKNQPDNVGAWRLGEACRSAQPGGDLIDYGLSLLKELQAKGYGVVALQPATSEGENNG